MINIFTCNPHPYASRDPISRAIETFVVDHTTLSCEGVELGKTSLQGHFKPCIGNANLYIFRADCAPLSGAQKLPTGRPYFPRVGQISYRLLPTGRPNFPQVGQNLYMSPPIGQLNFPRVGQISRGSAKFLTGRPNFSRVGQISHGPAKFPTGRPKFVHVTSHRSAKFPMGQPKFVHVSSTITQVA